MKFVVRPEFPTASVGSSQAPTAAVENSAPFVNRPQPTYKSGKAVQTNGATSLRRHCVLTLPATSSRSPIKKIVSPTTGSKVLQT
jgi:hypothetical protein